MAKLLNAIDVKVFNMNDLLESNYKAIEKYAYDVAKVIAIGLLDKPGDPSPRSIRVITNNFVSRDLYETLNIVVKQMDVQGFMYSLISVKGMELQNVPVTKADIDENVGELIAN